MTSLIIKVKGRRPRLITLTETLITLDITKTGSNNCFIIHCFEENNKIKKHHKEPEAILSLEIMHCVHNLQISCYLPADN